jgi:hypothetical protein
VSGAPLAHAQPSGSAAGAGPGDGAEASAEAEPSPTTAVQALGWATAAYETGDLQRMVDLSRLVAEGALPGDDGQRAHALRLLGIGLYLSGRPDGAERAFIELLRLQPRARLDPRVTRPEVVAFFQDVRRRHGPKKYWALALVPPLGQFQNETRRRGWAIGSLEALTLGSTIATRLVLRSWVKSSDGTCRNEPYNPTPCENVRLAHWTSAGLFAATWIYGVVDALVNLDLEEGGGGEYQVSLMVLPNAAGLRVTF